MANGKIKWFNKMKGFGFIEPEEGGSDVFLHITALEQAGISDVREGQRISFEITEHKGRSSASDIKLLDEAA